MAIFKCKMCGGSIDVHDGELVGTCEYCGTKQTFPNLNTDKKENLYDRANHFRRNNDYDKAIGIYEQILNEDSEDAEAYWSLVLCRYGIEYVEDPSTHKRIPTINRAQYSSIFADADYKAALEHADSNQKTIYEEEANKIDQIQKGILQISSKEEPFDVFICYKENDDSGRRTEDSVLANDLYHQLKQEGFKVFFSRITLEDKIGSAYEPYIFAALNSAKVMVVLGTKPEHFNAVWVKNEWSRFLTLIKEGKNKTLVPAYKNMDPYDLPEEFSHLQAQDMSKLGFMQDLLRGIKKITGNEHREEKSKLDPVRSAPAGNTDALIKRGNMALEDGDLQRADGFFEEVLNIDAECPEAYLGKWIASDREFIWRSLYTNYEIDSTEHSDLDAKWDPLIEQVNRVKLHSEEMTNKYYIEDYYYGKMIRIHYDTDGLRTYCIKKSSNDVGFEQFLDRSEQKYWTNEKNRVLNKIKEGKFYKRALEFSNANTKQEIEKAISKIESEYDEKIFQSRNNDENNERLMKEYVDGYLKHADEIVENEYKERKELKERKERDKEKSYREAIDYFNRAKSIIHFCKAKSRLKEQNGYGDSKQYISKCDEEIKKRMVKLSIRSGIVVAAIIIAIVLVTKIIIPWISFSNEYSNIKSAKVGDIVSFGKNNQCSYKFAKNGDDSDGHKFIFPSELNHSIRWRVLDVKKNDRVLLIANYIYKNPVQISQYEENKWKNSDIRKFLNGNYYENVFNDREKKVVLKTNLDNKLWGEKADKSIEDRNTSDRVFLLSYDEAKNYFSTDEKRVAYTYDYLNNVKDSRASWWLRTLIKNNKDYAVEYEQTYVKRDGIIVNPSYSMYDFYSKSAFRRDYAYLRPAIWVDISD